MTRSLVPASHYPSRRALLIGAACLLPQAANAVSSCLGEVSQRLNVGTRMFRHQESARIIGQRYLAREPTYAQMIVAAVQRLEQHARGRRDHSDEEVILFALESDYRSSRVVEIEGWVLSETEIAFCALAAMDAT